MLTSWAPIALFLIVALIFAVIPLVASRFLAPRRPDPAKLAPYESGMQTIGPTHVQFHTRYYLYALLFVIFDVEVVFLFPWAVAYGTLGLVSLIVVTIFVALILEGFIYAWKKGALEWR